MCRAASADSLDQRLCFGRRQGVVVDRYAARVRLVRLNRSDPIAGLIEEQEEVAERSLIVGGQLERTQGVRQGHRDVATLSCSLGGSVCRAGCLDPERCALALEPFVERRRPVHEEAGEKITAVE